ncbi:hypothetical protein DEU56DRAFT_869275 [Suillus clintonianus]|uniref:uncharacterized protein n=1 Tax=Suillus clintonianus TaxID=1904413 RepID=UPI001B87FB64|nr:uncharacterized protein DEU56DRAFT_869275 [Suillus clintonianus]KAG2150446.1 hypothetical protein DEU56DRAFT_869275 [Suillus clintonianus]
MSTSSFAQWLLVHYASTKSQSPNEGRRRWKLRVAQKFWASGEKTLSYTAAVGTAENIDLDFYIDSDPFDEASTDRQELGILVRTDFSDEAAWLAFCSRLEEGEKEFAASPSEEDDATMDNQPEPNRASHDTAAITTEEDDSEESDDELSAIFYIVNPSLPQECALLTNISNLAALRFFNDVDVRQAPTPPPDTKRIRPPNRLVDSGGWQEVYAGKNLWIYDAKSNSDQCVRVVSQTSSDMYGTATADSWRARVSHLCELQVNLSSGAMKIDFGGLDRWDYAERQRNMQEAEAPVVL